MKKLSLPFLLSLLTLVGVFAGSNFLSAAESSSPLLAVEDLSGEGVWVHPRLQNFPAGAAARILVWFDKQFLGDGKAYLRRAKEFSGAKRRELRGKVIRTLKACSDKSFAAAKADLDKLLAEKKIANLKRHWIINGFSCTVTKEGLDAIKKLPGVKKIFLRGGDKIDRTPTAFRAGGTVFPPVPHPAFKPTQYKHPWYIRYLLADRAWTSFGATGKGVLNVIHDFYFVYSPNVTRNLYRNLKEIPGNGKDDDGNGLVDDYHGYNFRANSPNLALGSHAATHGFSCAAIICGVGTPQTPYGFGIAPDATWAGVIGELEPAVEWAIEQGADTYSMSFSHPGLGENRTIWRKVMEQGSFCGVYFVSGAGNFAQKGSKQFAPVPVQMRTPEDIPEVVFAAAGVQRDFSRTSFSSQGPVVWNTEHYHDGKIQKPEVCGFNANLPTLTPSGKVRDGGLNGNSFAGPMFCGTIALMLSADPDLLPWDLKQIITSTATDVAAPGVDYQTGYGLINCYRAVKEVLRRKAIREGKDPKAYTGREANDTLDLAAIKKTLANSQVIAVQVRPGFTGAKAGMKVGDVFVSYNGVNIKKISDLIRAFIKTQKSGAKIVPLVVKRNGKKISLQIAAGAIGIAPKLKYLDVPVFK